MGPHRAFPYITLAAALLPAPVWAGDLTRQLQDRDPQVRARATAALTRLEGPALRAELPAAITALGSDNAFVARDAADALARLGAPAVPALCDALKSPDARLRGRAAMALSRIGAKDLTPALPALLAAMKDPDCRVRQWSVVALGHVGSGVTKSLPTLLAALRDPQVTVRWGAASALANLQDDVRDSGLLVPSLFEEGNGLLPSLADAFQRIDATKPRPPLGPR